ncbi:calmodulin-interacting protein 111 isoform X1 [Ricinus communis]|uniref:calmodulin-interacting protein 111 isoform X1 n=1 Tax=Ricinus communis TaxID=3988 RepID=UPI00201B07ED|nr:calmodulin-interacting protein 111 isoform X1 [Ricinus communis]
MPSKVKKHPKTASRLSNAEHSQSPRTPSLISSCDDLLEVSEQDVAISLQEASNRYPSMIGNSAFIGRLTDVDPHSKGCKIWLSESSMVASSISPGSIVSVSLAASGRRVSNPLISIPGEFARQFEVENLDETTNEVGNYFAFATVFPSCKALKDGVRFSSSLSYTMGCPASGRLVFVYPVQNQLLSGLVNGDSKPNDKKIDSLSSHNFYELHLELVPVKDRVKQSSDVISKMNSAEKTHGQSENGKNSSPRTPLCQPKLSSSSPSLSASSRCEEAMSNLSNRRQTHVDSFDIKEVLKDESVKQLLQACVVSWLYSRILICGNIVAIPILSELCIFRVVSANQSLEDNQNQDLIKERSNSVCPQSSESMDHLKETISINHETKVYLHLPMNSACKTPYRSSLSFTQIENVHVKSVMAHEITKLGGLHKEYAVLKDIILSTMKNDFLSLGLRPTKGVLLHGPTGTGKTSLARLCALDAGVNLLSVNGPEIISQYHGESEQALHEVFASASQGAPAVVFIDELDSIAPARKDGGEALSQRMVATLLNLMDGVSRTDGVIIIAATNRPDSIEPALRRPGRLDREIEIGVPSPKQRLDILNTLLSQREHSLSDLQVQHLAVATHGFVGADLAALCNEAALICLRRYVKSRKSNNYLHSMGSPTVGESYHEIMLNGSSETCEDSVSSNLQSLAASSENSLSTSEAILVAEESILKVVFEDFEKARMKVRPSAMREVILEVPKVNWEDVGGQKEVKAQLMEAVEWPQKHQDAFQRIGTRPPTGVLMFGPPGCSKTLMARAVASEAGLNFFAVKGPELFSKWVGESEKAVRSLFAKARANAPSIIFFDEIDGLAVIRGKENDGVSVSDRVMTQLLVELDGLHQRVNVTVIAATNRPDKIDPALLRPGRFDRLLYVGPPNATDREAIFRIHLRKIPCSSDVSIKELSHLTEGCTGADISFICREAAMAAIEECIDASEVTMKHTRTAIRQAKPLNTESYNELSAKFQRLVHSNHRQDCLEEPKSSTSSNRFHFWTMMKSTMQFLVHFLAPGSKSTSSG